MKSIQDYKRNFIYLGFFTLFSMALQATEQLDGLRELTHEWVALEQSISKEALAWEEKQSQLNDFIKIAKIEVEQLKAELGDLEKVATTADERRQELITKQEELNQHAAVIRPFLEKMEMSLRTLKVRLPQPLQDKLEAAYHKLPKDSKSTSLGIAERMQNVVSILSSIQQFDDRITVTQELKTLPDQSQGEVTTLYIGLATAYYVTTAGNDAGYAYPTETGWTWESNPSLMDAIKEAIEIANGVSQKAKFIELPITLNK